MQVVPEHVHEHIIAKHPGIDGYVRDFKTVERQLAAALETIRHYADIRQYNAVVGEQTVRGNTPIQQSDRGSRARNAMREIEAIGEGLTGEELNRRVYEKIAEDQNSQDPLYAVYSPRHRGWVTVDCDGKWATNTPANSYEVIRGPRKSMERLREFLVEEVVPAEVDMDVRVYVEGVE